MIAAQQKIRSRSSSTYPPANIRRHGGSTKLVRMLGHSDALRSLFYTSALLLLTACPVDQGQDDDDASDAAVPPELVAALQETLEEMLDDVPATGLTAAIAFGDGAVWTGAVGSTHPEGFDDRRAIVSGDLFNIASITKSFTAGLILSLVEEEIVALEDTFEAWVPGGHARGGEITVRQLLLHTAGVPEYTATAGFQGNYGGTWTGQELVALVSDLDLVNEPGATVAYSNSHFIMLSLVAEAATGMPWQDELAERVLVPLNLEDTTAPALGDGWGEVVPTWLGSNPFPQFVDPTGIGAAGSIVSDADDVARWTRARFGGGFLGPELTGAQVQDLEPLGGPFSMGLGALVMDEEGSALEQGHNGALNGYAGWSGYRPDIDAAITLLGNAWGAGNPPDYSYPLGLHLDLWAVVDEHLSSGD